MNQGQPTCVVAGHICLDIIPDLLNQKGFLAAIRPGHLLAIGPPQMTPGGSVSNTGRALQKLGIKTRLMGKLGDDAFGHELRALLGQVDPELVAQMKTTPGEHTSYSFILSPADSDRVFLHSSGANDTFDAADIDYSQLGAAAMFHFGYPTLMASMLADDGRELAAVFQRAKAGGVTTSLDMSMFDRHGPAGQVEWPHLLARTLPYVDIFVPSLDEICLMLAPQRDPERLAVAEIRELAARLLGFGAKIVMLKQGRRGLYLRTQNGGEGVDYGRAFSAGAGTWAGREMWATAFVVDDVGSTGAGDCAVAGLLAAILRGESAPGSLRMAAAVGACNVEAADAYSGVRTWDETQARIAAGWPLHALDLPGWEYDAAAQLWLGPDDSRAVA